MKCQSDYDTKDQAVFRQADECLEDWWSGESPEDKNLPTNAESLDTNSSAAKNEALRRGLLRKDDNGDLCLSCAEIDEN